MSSQQVLVLGADGFIGRRVVAALAACDWAEPVAAGRRPPPPSADGLRRIRLDATDEGALAAALNDVDGVVNCIAGSAETIAAGAHALFAAAARSGYPRVVHLSTMSVYGSATGDIDETAALRGDLGAYAEAKVAAERAAAAYPGAVLLRPGCVYGPGSPQWSERIAQWLLARRVGDLGAAGDGYCNLVHVDDVVQAVLRGLSHPAAEGQAFNLATPEPPTWNEYFVSYAKALGAVPARRVPARRLKLETRVLAIPLKVAEIAARKLHLSMRSLPQPIPPSLARLWQQEIRLSTRKAEGLLGLRWKPVETGLRETADWYLRGRAAVV